MSMFENKKHIKLKNVDINISTDRQFTQCGIVNNSVEKNGKNERKVRIIKEVMFKTNY